MTKATLVSNVAITLSEKTGKSVTKKLAADVLDAVVETFASQILSAGKLSISGFGSFEVKARPYLILPGRPGETKDRSLGHKEDRKNVRFRPAKVLKTALNTPVSAAV